VCINLLLLPAAPPPALLWWRKPASMLSLPLLSACLL
jgi:hypothetical protein